MLATAKVSDRYNSFIVAKVESKYLKRWSFCQKLLTAYSNPKVHTHTHIHAVSRYILHAASLKFH